MKLFNTKFFKLALSSIVLAFVVFLLSVSNIFPNKIIHNAEAVDITTTYFDDCSITRSLSGNFTRSGGAPCNVYKITGLAASSTDPLNKGDLIISNSAEIIIKQGAELIVSPEAEIKFETGGKITLETGGAANSGISRGYLCAPDNDQDGYINSSFTDFTKVLSSVPLATPCATGYTEKGKLRSTTVYDCNDANQNFSNICCIVGFRDYDKDGDGVHSDISACYEPSASYNVVSNNNDCDDTNATIKNGWSATTFCGIGGCGGSGTQSCVSGVYVDTVPCVTSTKLCCDATGAYKLAQTPVGTCQKCNGTSADPVNQLSSEDLSNQCATGALGSATSCQGLNCSGLGGYCGSLADATICNYGSYSAYSGASGSCYLTSSRDIYKCSTGTCSGTSSGTDYQANQNANAVGNIWNGSVWTAATCTLNTGYGSVGYYCSPNTAYNSVAQRLAYGCNTSGSLDTTTPKATCNQTTCSNRTENGISCSSGSCLASNCSDGLDNDGDGYIDAGDINCSAGGQCVPNSACCDANGFYLASGSICSYDSWSAWSGTNGACSLSQTQGYHTCNATGTCSTAVTGTNYNYQYAPSEGKIVSSNAWITATSVLNRGITSPYSCSGLTTIIGSYVGCNTSGSTGTVPQGTKATGVTCTGNESNMCVAGNSSCVNACVAPYLPTDNDGDGYNDYQDSNCDGGYSLCNSGICCNLSNGNWCPVNTYWNGSSCAAGACLSGSFNNPAATSCQRTATDTNCSGTSATCNGAYSYRYQNAPADGYIWNGSSWVVSSCSLNAATSIPYDCSGNSVVYNYYGCNTSGGVPSAVMGTCTFQTCSGGTPYCYDPGGTNNGICVQCTERAQCPSDYYYCSGNQAYYRTYSCSSNSCAYFDATTTYCNSTGTQMCTNGTCAPTCEPTVIDGFSIPRLAYGTGIGVNKPACYRSVGGYYSTTAVCNSGTVNIQGTTGPTCYSGYTYVYGSWYQSTYGCYDVCVLSTCPAGSNGGYSYPALSHGSSPVYSRSITNGSCSANINCTDGSTYVQNESCSCNAGYYISGTSCLACTAGNYCPGGTSGQITCPSGTTSGATASVCYCPVSSGQGYTYPVTNYGSTNYMSKTSSPGSCYAYRNCDPVNDPFHPLVYDGCTCPSGYGVMSDKVAPPTIWCSICDAGYFSPGTDHLAIGGCSECPPGTYCSNPGTGSPYVCPAGYYCTGGTNLTYCGTGYSSPSGSDAYNDCYWVGS